MGTIFQRSDRIPGAVSPSESASWRTSVERLVEEFRFVASRYRRTYNATSRS